MTFDEWIKLGMLKEWISPPMCATHDGVPMTAEETEEAWEGGDPCVHVLRLYESAEQRQDAEETYRSNYGPMLDERRRPYDD